MSPDGTKVIVGGSFQNVNGRRPTAWRHRPDHRRAAAVADHPGDPQRRRQLRDPQPDAPTAPRSTAPATTSAPAATSRASFSRRTPTPATSTGSRTATATPTTSAPAARARLHRQPRALLRQRRRLPAVRPAGASTCSARSPSPRTPPAPLGHDPHGYSDFYGTPSPSMLNWFPRADRRHLHRQDPGRLDRHRQQPVRRPRRRVPDRQRHRPSRASSGSRSRRIAPNKVGPESTRARSSTRAWSPCRPARSGSPGRPTGTGTT